MKTFKQFLEEDGEGATAPANNVGCGAIAGVGIGPQGEPGVNMKKKKTPIITPTLTRKI
jgi:hypothetical protein